MADDALLLPPRAVAHADDLRALGHGVVLLHQQPFGRRVVAEGISVTEGAPEHGQVQRGLVVGRRMENGRHLDLSDGGHRRVVHVGVEGNDVGVAGTDRVNELRGDGTVVVHPLATLFPTHQLRSHAQEAVEGVEGGQPPVIGGEAVHGHAVDLRVARLQVVVPGDRIQSAGGEGLGVPLGQGVQVLGQLASGRLGPAHNLGPVARGDEGDLHRGAPATLATAATSWAATVSQANVAARRCPAARRWSRRVASVMTRRNAAAT